MKAAIAGIVIAGVLIGIVALAYTAGLNVGRTTSYRNMLRRNGMTRHAATLYREATQIMFRLAQVGDLTGYNAGDYLSPETKKMVTDWVTDYKNEVAKQ